MPNLGGRLAVAVSDLWCTLNAREATCVEEFLQENFSKDFICLVPENGTEDDRYAIIRRNNIDSFLLAVTS